MDVFVVIGSIFDELWVVEDLHAEYAEDVVEEGIKQKKADYYWYDLDYGREETFQLLNNVYLLVTHILALQDQLNHPCYPQHSVDLEEIIDTVANGHEKENHIHAYQEGIQCVPFLRKVHLRAISHNLQDNFSNEEPNEDVVNHLAGIISSIEQDKGIDATKSSIYSHHQLKNPVIDYLLQIDGTID